MPYHHITKEERVKIEAWFMSGERPADMARWLGRHRSSIGRELERVHEIFGSQRTYRAKEGEERRRAVSRAANQARRQLVEGGALTIWVEKKLRRRWSPEQIAGRLKKYPPRHLKGQIICHETIYQYVYDHHPELIMFLRRGKKKYRRNRGTKAKNKAREAQRLRSIEERPKVVEARKRLGDWEGDTIVGKEKIERIVTHAERKSGKLVAARSTATAETVVRVTAKRFKQIAKEKRHTITYDRGSEFAEQPSLEKNLGLTVYFAHAYHSWERGTNENTNGLLRQYYPKGSSFREVTERALQRVVREINDRPRKRLRWKTPDEVFYGRSPVAV